MAEPCEPEPVKRIVAVLWACAQARDEALLELQKHWGPADYQSPDFPFDVTDYYQDQMGRELFRRLVSFEQLVSPDCLVPDKLLCNALENRFRTSQGRRLVNLDSGYLDHNKLVLASAKAAGQKIYVGQGIWADIQSRYRRGRYEPFEWTFPDFRSTRYDEPLRHIRQLYLQQRRQLLHRG